MSTCQVFPPRVKAISGSQGAIVERGLVFIVVPARRHASIGKTRYVNCIVPVIRVSFWRQVINGRGCKLFFSYLFRFIFRPYGILERCVTIYRTRWQTKIRSWGRGTFILGFGALSTGSVSRINRATFAPFHFVISKGSMVFRL